MSTLTIKVHPGEEYQYAYAVKLTEAPLGVATSILTATVEDYGTHTIFFDASFDLANPGITFPKGQPDYITLAQDGNTVALTVQVDRGGPWPATVDLKIEQSEHLRGDIPNEPTILVDPPGHL
ncbi:MAG TPA: hypothetical protein VGS22_25635 [Thermoanaerobaculia bacterium]|jgi:hypothetical protein|nr:hypothetical protein [Thermoanaerobaculia bacterium]